MRFTLKSFQPVFGSFFACGLVMLIPTAFGGSAFADGAFVDQAGKGGSHSGRSYAPTLPTAQTPTSSFGPRSGSTPVTPEAAMATGGNVATTLEMGRYNRVFQGQAGSGNVSNVGIIKGSYNNVGVLQAGHSLTSNLLLVNTQGLSVGVIQPNGSAPVNMLIARLPNGGLLIKR
jgi:hypothetical protein